MSPSEQNPPKIIRVDTASLDRESLRQAVEILGDGGLVAFPTETVYGLGADARSGEAVRGIFRAKGRPSTHPLIVHVADSEAAAGLSARWDARARALAEAFWPGPLTLIVPRAEAVPDVVTGGLDTVGIRVPDHPVALALLEEAQMPLAAPSANRHQGISPTRAEHVQRSLGAQVDMIIDGGATEVGIESTVLSLAVDPPVILRPGQISREEIREVLEAVRDEAPVGRAGGAEGDEGGGEGGGTDVAYGDEAVDDDKRQRPSPGMAGRHYAPEARVVLASGEKLIASCRDAGADRPDRDVGWLLIDAELPEPCAGLEATVIERMPADPETYAAKLYQALHTLEEEGCDVICIEAPPREEEWRAVWNRLERAAC